MNPRHSLPVAAILTISVTSSARVLAQCDDWRAGPLVEMTGMDGFVLAVTTWDPDGAGPLPPQLVVGGNFTTAGGTTVNGIARWDGSVWQPFASGFDGVSPNSFTAVRALAVLPASFGAMAGQLVAGGDFTTASGVTVNGLARWDGNAWRSMGGVGNSSSRGVVYAMTVVSGSGALAGELVVGGQFATVGGASAANIAHWNGTTWQSVGPGIDGAVYAVTSWDPDGAGPMQPEVVAGGYFEWDASHLALLFNIGRWDGTVWRPFQMGTFPEQSTGLDQAIHALSSLPVTLGAPLGGGLGVGGQFIGTANVSFPQELGKFTSWDGSQWTRLAAGIDASHAYWSINALSVIPTGNGPFAGQLVVAGDFMTAGGVTVNNISRWDASAWQPLASGFDDKVYALTTWDPDGSGSQTAQLVAGGRFGFAGSTLVNSIAHYDGGAWLSLGQSATGAQVFALTQFGSRMVAGGSFSFGASTGPAPHNIAQWDGVAISPFGSGFNAPVHALRSFNTTQFGVTLYHLVAGGEFTTAGGVTANRIAEWTENPLGNLQPPAWVALGNGFSGNVYAIERFNNVIYAGGNFTASQDLSTALGRIAMWNGTSWAQPGAGLNGTCYALKVYNSQLYAGGSFTTAGGLSSGGLARWDGSNWSIVGGNFLGTVYSLEVYNGDLIIGGSYPGITGNPNIARYNSVSGSYSTLGSGGADGTVYSLFSEGGNLYVGGTFTHAGGVATANIARWNGASWSAVRSGSDGSVLALAAMQGEVHVGGTFSNVRGTALASPAWARYLETGMPWLPRQPFDTSALCAGEATLSAKVSSGYAVSWQWRHNGMPFFSGPTTTGSTIEITSAGTLTIDNISAADQGIYDVMLSASCGSATSSSATLTVTGSGSDADGNGDGLANGEDINDFISTVITGVSQGRGICAYDMNSDGVVDLGDLPLFTASLLSQ